MDIKDQELLEFPRIREIVAGYCSFSISRKMATDLSPSDNIDEIQTKLTETKEARILIETEGGASADGVEDIRDYSVAASRGQIIDSKTLRIIGNALQTMRLLRNLITASSDNYPMLTKYANLIGEFAPIEKAIDRAISPDGEILPNASPELTAIRRNQQSKKTALINTLQGLISTGTQNHYIQEALITEREGRYVIPVKSEFRKDIQGIVHDVSNSGATLFIEPLQALELGNALKEEQIREKQEIARILTEISALVGGVSEDIIESIEAVAVIDLALAKARFARRFKANEPEVFLPDEKTPTVIKLDSARHPLLGDSAVPLSLEIGNDFSILTITGPNTGGKTVALKTIGLLCMMTQAGLPIPAGPASRLPVLNGIYADIGDEQSIAQTLSTFSWHMSNIARILRKLQGFNLILLDELGASTDPGEGSALGRAILLHILASKSLAVITTHYTDLKVFAHITQGLQNASFDFDPETMTPTYKLTLGTPGGSNAIATAAHFGLPKEVISTARNSLQEGSRQLEELLTNIQQEKQRLENLNRELEDEKKIFTRQNKELTTELKKFNEEKERLRQNARDSIIEEVARLERELKTVTAELRRAKSEETIRKARQASQSVRRQISEGILAESDEILPEEDTEINVGDNVLIKEVGVKATVIAINDKTGQVEVSSGSMSFKTAKNSIIKLAGSEFKDKTFEVKVQVPLKQISPELDLRGKRADEVEVLLDNYLSDAAVSNLKRVRIIHGYGTGTVRSMVRDLASCHPLVKNFETVPATEGGDGVTVINLR
ncbi:MAG: endonuclease MutS2 [Dehalococcoidales bacterium]